MFDTTGLEELAAKAAGCDEHLLADDELVAGVRSIEAARRFLDAAEGSMLAELDARNTTDIVTGLRTAGWLAREAGVSPATARRRVRVGNVLRTDLPGTDRAVREGRLCADRARVMADAVNERIVAEFQQMEESLIEESAQMTFNAWAQRVRLVAALLDEDGPQPQDDPLNNKLALKGGPAGMAVGGKLYGDLAVVVRAAIEQMADELFRRFSEDADVTGGEVAVPSRATLRGMALAELCRRGLMVDADGDAVSRPKVEATLAINAETPDEVFDDQGYRVGRAEDSALVCDLSVWAIILNRLGVPLDMGREIRTANRAQRRALARRDGGCVFPGCGVGPDHSDAHHVAGWHRDLGTTDVKLMVFLCRHHHGVIHRKGWKLHITDDGWAWITTPGGQRLWCQRHGTTRAGPPPG